MKKKVVANYRYVDELLYWSGKRLSLEDCLRGDLTPHRLPPSWISHDKFVYQADDGSLTLLDTSNNTVSLLVSNHTLVCYLKYKTSLFYNDICEKKANQNY